MIYEARESHSLYVHIYIFSVISGIGQFFLDWVLPRFTQQILSNTILELDTKKCNMIYEARESHSLYVHIYIFSVISGIGQFFLDWVLPRFTQQILSNTILELDTKKCNMIYEARESHSLYVHIYIFSVISGIGQFFLDWVLPRYTQQILSNTILELDTKKCNMIYEARESHSLYVHIYIFSVISGIGQFFLDWVLPRFTQQILSNTILELDTKKCNMIYEARESHSLYVHIYIFSVISGIGQFFLDWVLPRFTQQILSNTILELDTKKCNMIYEARESHSLYVHIYIFSVISGIGQFFLDWVLPRFTQQILSNTILELDTKKCNMIYEARESHSLYVHIYIFSVISGIGQFFLDWVLPRFTQQILSNTILELDTKKCNMIYEARESHSLYVHIYIFSVISGIGQFFLDWVLPRFTQQILSNTILELDTKKCNMIYEARESHSLYVHIYIFSVISGIGQFFLDWVLPRFTQQILSNTILELDTKKCNMIYEARESHSLYVHIYIFSVISGIGQFFLDWVLPRYTQQILSNTILELDTKKCNMIYEARESHSLYVHIYIFSVISGIGQFFLDWVLPRFTQQILSNTILELDTKKCNMIYEARESHSLYVHIYIFSVISGIGQFFLDWVLPGYTQHILSPTILELDTKKCNMIYEARESHLLYFHM